MNATLDRSPGEDVTVDWLTSTHDASTGEWYLAGKLDGNEGADSNLGFWGTAGDPLNPVFAREIYSVGSGTMALSSAPALDPPSVNPGSDDDIPVAAFRCVGLHP